MTWLTQSSLFRASHPLLEAVREGHRITPLVIALWLVPVMVVVSQLFSVPVIMPVFFFLPPETTQALLESELNFGVLPLVSGALAQFLLLVFAFSPVFLLLWLWVHFFERRPYSGLGFRDVAWLGHYLRGFGVGLLLFGSAVALMALSGNLQFEGFGWQRDGSLVWLTVLLVLLGWVVQGAAEEVIHRGWLLPVLAAKHKMWVGVLLSSLVFAVLHSLNPNLSPIAVLNLFLFGLFAAFYTLYEGGIWGVFSIHSAWNWLQGNVFGFEVSGTVPAGGSLLRLQEAGPDWLTGGRFGPEGGLAVTLVLLVACGLLLWLAARRTNREAA